MNQVPTPRGVPCAPPGAGVLQKGHIHYPQVLKRVAAEGAAGAWPGRAVCGGKRGTYTRSWSFHLGDQSQVKGDERVHVS
eukprot:scaffold7234_cov335-Prasinococcus_capsulatus_cf.AAC.8